MNNLIKSLYKTQFLTVKPMFCYHFPETKFPTASKNPAVTAKRIIKVVGERLRKLDPQRWNSTPITFQTHWNDEGGYADIATSIQIHDAIEKEFGIEIRDRGFLITDVPAAFYIVMLHHDSI